MRIGVQIVEAIGNPALAIGFDGAFVQVGTIAQAINFIPLFLGLREAVVDLVQYFNFALERPVS